MAAILWLAASVVALASGEDIATGQCNTLPEPSLLKPGSLPVTALASFQGSGNTWLRQILATTTGFKTGDIYNSNGNDIFPEFSSLHDDQVIAIKMHLFSPYPVSEYQVKRAIVVVRNPLEALFAEFNRLYGGSKTAHADLGYIYNPDGSTTWLWDVWTTYIATWVDFYAFWIKAFPGPVHIVYYNRLKSDLRPELIDMVTFLGIKLDPARLNCTVNHQKVYFKRQKAPFDTATLFSFSLCKAEKAIQAVKKLVEERFGTTSPSYLLFNLDLNRES